MHLRLGEKSLRPTGLDFKNNEVSALERLVNNNPLLYGVRVYAVNDSVQEMMPILYKASRMKKQEWSKQDKYVGWNFDYTDKYFQFLYDEPESEDYFTCHTDY